jgi:hypothetical protein
MELNGLEMTLIAGAIATGAAWISTTIQARQYQTRVQCDERHASVCKGMDDLTGKQDRDTALIMRMLRSLIVHSDIPEAEKERILNDRGAK